MGKEEGRNVVPEINLHLKHIFKVSIVVFSDVTQCSFSGSYQCFRGIYHLHLQDKSEYGALKMDATCSSKMLVTNLLQDYATPQARRSYSTSSLQ
jgi:hypothetical protein